MSTNRKEVGGQFWDGRAANLAEQAKGPILYILSKDLIETKKITYIDIKMRLYFLVH